MSELSDAAAELQAAYEEALGGKPIVVLIDGQRYPARYSDVTSDEIMLLGGIGEAGGFRVWVPCDKMAGAPEQGASIFDLRNENGRELQILSAINRNGVEWEITAGDLSAENR